MTAAEEWRPVVGYEGAYEVSSYGRVRSLERVIMRRNGCQQRVHARILRPTIARHRGNYPTYSLSKGSPRRTAHALVAGAFIGPVPAGHEVLHRDGNPQNNHVSNLGYGTHGQNMLDIVRHGRHTWANRTKCPRDHALITPNLVASKIDGRTCLACARARAKLHYAAKQGLALDLQAVSDGYYADIMRGA